MDGLYCLQKVRDAAKELLDVVEVMQAQEQDLSVVDILLATHRTMQVLLGEVTAIRVHLARLEPSLAKSMAPEHLLERTEIGCSRDKLSSEGLANASECDFKIGRHVRCLPCNQTATLPPNLNTLPHLPSPSNFHHAGQHG
jgi:hypothetical protein